jgi:hypothetical protein
MYFLILLEEEILLISYFLFILIPHPPHAAYRLWGVNNPKTRRLRRTPGEKQRPKLDPRPTD